MINEKDLFIKASALWGIGFQFEMAKEELAELIVSISHYQRGKENQPNLVKEIVDVQILINQLRAMLGIQDDGFQEIYNKEISRLNNMVEDAIQTSDGSAALAVKISENLSAKEQSFFVAGFQEAIKAIPK